ncbi:MAG: protease modulator HflC [Spirochaetia bacterium]|nr:protease modulator HflC [Spirochaetia bacterium]MCF7946466.1 protease modulator HflC [Spirochaetia bacterium]
MKKLVTTLVVLVVLVIIIFLLGPFYRINEGEQSVITRFGAITKSTTEAGLKFKMPIVDNVVKYPKKILSWDGDAQRVPTSENQFIWVDTTARWKISDPALFYESVTTLQQGLARLDDVIDSAVRTIIAENELIEAVRNSNEINSIDRELEVTEPDEIMESEQLEQLKQLTVTDKTYERISIGREALSQQMLDSVKELTKSFGIEIIDIIIRQIQYSDDLTQSVYNRMIKERNQIAEAYRSFGEGQKQEWLGKLENDRKRILSEAYEKSETIKGEADAEAVGIYAKSYEKDPEFFKFWKSIESYKKVLPEFQKTLTTDMNYFQYLYSENGDASINE